MEWKSPWGIGFPGWHLECSAMSIKELGEEFDIHASGIDHIPVHHTNERAQNWGLTGKETVKYWIHSEFLLVDGGKMGKSLGNLITLKQIEEKGFSPMAFRYSALQAHYRSKLNFTWEALEAAQHGLNNLIKEISTLDKPRGSFIEFEKKFEATINDDLNTPEALAVLQALLKSNLSSAAKRAGVMKFDKVLGLGLNTYKIEKTLNAEIQSLIEQRQEARKNKDYKQSDELRKKIEGAGVKLKDLPDGNYEIE